MIRTLLALTLIAWSAAAHGQDVDESLDVADAPADQPAAELEAEQPAAELEAEQPPVAQASAEEVTAAENAQPESEHGDALPHLSTTEMIRAPAHDEQATGDANYWRFVGALSIHGSLLSSVAGRSTLDLTYGGALRFGARHGSNQLTFVADYSGWQSLEDRSVITFGTLNLAAEYTRTFFSDVVAVSLAVGPSILLTDTLLDDAGSVGLFIDLRPAGFRWRMTHVNIGLDPLSFTVVAPVLGALPLVRVQYRTTLTVEFRP